MAGIWGNGGFSLPLSEKSFENRGEGGGIWGGNGGREGRDWVIKGVWERGG